MAPRVGTSFWKVAGLSYLQYLNVSTRALSKTLKVQRNRNNPLLKLIYFLRRSRRRAGLWQDKVFLIIKLLET